MSVPKIIKTRLNFCQSIIIHTFPSHAREVPGPPAGENILATTGCHILIIASKLCASGKFLIYSFDP